MKTIEKLWVVALFLVAATIFEPPSKPVKQLAENPEPAPFRLVSVARAQIPIKIGSLTQIATLPANSVFIVTVPGVTNYIISAANLLSSISSGLGTNTVVISNAYITTLNATNINVFSNLESLFISAGFIQSTTITVTGNAQFSSNLYVGGTNFNNYLFTSNTAYLNGAVIRTNRVVDVATNADSVTLDFAGAYDWYRVATFLKTNLVLSPTNLLVGQEISVWFGPTNCDFNVTITNVPANVVRWVGAYKTNGDYSFTVTNGTVVQAVISCVGKDYVEAVYAQKN